MKAIVCRAYGLPGSLAVEEVERPVAGDTELLLRVEAAAINALDWHLQLDEVPAASPAELTAQRPAESRSLGPAQGRTG